MFKIQKSALFIFVTAMPLGLTKLKLNLKSSLFCPGGRGEAEACAYVCVCHIITNRVLLEVNYFLRFLHIFIYIIFLHTMGVWVETMLGAEGG